VPEEVSATDARTAMQVALSRWTKMRSKAMCRKHGGRLAGRMLRPGTAVTRI